MKSKRQVFMNSDGKGITLLSVAVYSLLRHNDPKKPIDVFIAHDTTFATAGGVARLKDVAGVFPFATLHFIDITSVLEDYRGRLSCHGFSPMVWAFPLCTKILPQSVTGRIVYIDIDMLIRKDLAPLFDANLLDGRFIAAAVNESRREHRQYLVDAGWPESAGYSFNNATCVLDLDAYRRDGIADRIVEWYAIHKDIAINVDQDAQNRIFGDRTKRLPVKWNYTDGWLERLPKLNPFAREWRVFPPKEMLEAILDPCIIHYIGHRKPTAWTHRPERRVYRKAMEEIGLITGGRLPGETGPRIVLGLLFDAYHLLLKGYARLLLAFRA